MNALETFLARKSEIDQQILAELQQLCEDHFNVAPDEVNWGHVGSISHTLELLRRAKDEALR